MYALDMAKRKKQPAMTPKQVRAARTARGLTQTEAAERVGVSLRSWQAWESGEQVPTPSHVLLIRLLTDGKI